MIPLYFNLKKDSYYGNLYPIFISNIRIYLVPFKKTIMLVWCHIIYGKKKIISIKHIKKNYIIGILMFRGRLLLHSKRKKYALIHLYEDKAGSG